jgi:hypothetical protein
MNNKKQPDMLLGLSLSGPPRLNQSQPHLIPNNRGHRPERLNIHHTSRRHEASSTARRRPQIRRYKIAGSRGARGRATTARRLENLAHLIFRHDLSRRARFCLHFSACSTLGTPNPEVRWKAVA